MNITLERVGRRTYLRGETFPVKDSIKDAGGHWDADARAWWLGDNAKAEIIAKRASVEVVPARYVKVGDDWCVKGKGLVVGQEIVVQKASGDKKTERVTAILSTDPDGVQTASVAKSTKPSGTYTPRRSFNGYGGAARTGCSCGSREGVSRDSDCAQCRYDNE